MKKLALTIKHLTVAYNNKTVLWDVNIAIPQGKLVGIIGPNGAGKTTLIKSVMGLIKPLTGSIEILGNQQQKCINNIAYVPQRSSVDWDFPINALEVVLMGAYQRLGWFSRPKKSDRIKAGQILELVGIADKADTHIRQLSGGQQQRVFIARALMQQAPLYLMDEPFAGVDMATEKTIVAILKQLCSNGNTILIVHHDLAKLQDYFDWLIMLNVSTIACGPIDQVLHEDNISRTYEKITL